ncbi:MAG: TonB-dependent receptor [Deltaproteobacteria bacterium]|nr:TonB-dependent receptor [Deltaproteobacteria bacterium]
MKMKRLKTILCFFLLIFAFVFVVHADEIGYKQQSEVKLEKTVVTSTLTPKVIKEAPGALEVITAEEIRVKGAETVVQILEDAVGIDLDHVAGRGYIPQIRGLSNKRTLILIDGMRFSTGFRDTTVDLTEFPTEIIERIEIVRGPNSALYGSEAIGGVINIITKNAPKKLSESVTVRYGRNTYGEAENYIFKGSVGDTFENLGIIVSGHVNRSGEFDRDPDDNETDFDDEEKYSGLFKLNYSFADNHRFSAGVFYSDASRKGIRPKYGLKWDRNADSDRTSTFLQYNGVIKETTVMVRGYYSDFESDRSYIDIGYPYDDPKLQNKAKQQPDREDFNIKNELYQVESRASRIFAQSHLITLGLEYREEERSGKENRGEKELNESTNNRAIFLQDDFPIFDWLQVTAGIRLDDHSDFGSEVSPRLSLNYYLLDNLRLKASYGEGFRAPSLYELYVYTENTKGDVIPNPDLAPETSQSYEAGLEGEYGPFGGKIMAFRNNIDDMIYKTPTGNYRMQKQGKEDKKVLEYERCNIDEAYTQGIELEVSIAFPHHFSLAGNTVFIDSNNEDTDEDLLEVPDMKSYLRLSYDNPDIGLQANIRMNYTGKQVIAPKFKDGTQTDADSYIMWNLYTEKEIKKNFKIFAGIDNIFNKKISHTPDKGTFFYGGISVSL